MTGPFLWGCVRRFANTFYEWQSYITIFDDSVSASMEGRLYSVLAPGSSVSMFRMPRG